MITSSERAKKRWKILSDVLLKNRVVFFVSNTTKLEQTFNLLNIDQEIYDDVRGTFSCKISFRNEFLTEFHRRELKIRLLTNSIDLDDLIGFDNTGNVRIWPSEEILSYYCMKNAEIFRNKSVCELGAGMTGLASFLLAKTKLPKRLLITDGNEKSARNLKFIKQTNFPSFNDKETNFTPSEDEETNFTPFNEKETNFPLCNDDLEIETRRLLWNDDADEKTDELLKNCFDIILAADCFFFKSADEILLKTIDRLLKPNGIAIFFAPLRNGTFRRFVEAVKNSKAFRISYPETEDYCPKISQIKENLLKDPKFDFNYVYPFMLQIEKIGGGYENLSLLVEDNPNVMKLPRLS